MDNEKQPVGYDLSLEVLCTIPPAPGFVEVEDLVAEFGFDNYSGLKKVLAKLGLAGVNVPGGRVVSIPEGRWAELRLIGETYWDRVYPDGA